MPEAVVKCRGISKHYGEEETLVKALQDINIDIFPGQLTLLVGPSGSGKTTLLSIITNILTADKGELTILDQDMSRLNEEQKAAFCLKHLGIVFQSLFLIPTLTAAENVALPLLLDGHTQEESLDKAIDILKRMKIIHHADISPANLSRGQQQRIAIARAMVNNATIIVCDEPTSALDQHSGLAVMELLHEVASNSSKAVIVVTHDHRTFPYADRIINMSDGQIIPGEDHA